MTPALLLLARHGETDWNRERKVQGHTDIPLNEEGRRQAQRLAVRVKGFAIDALLASDLARASETARIVGDALGMAPVLSPAWREIGLGALEGIDAPGAHKDFGELVTAAARQPGPLAAGAETFRAFEARILEGYGALARAHAGKTVLVVSHGGTLKTLIAHLVGLPAERIERLSLRANTGLSVIDFRHDRPQLALLNDARHLEDRWTS
ncbi:MAG TPA: histidine phosphatase family protein [Planctomycetota bacterium]|nr:histidine phosphatase family protein [Planctomycetota bacterium]